MLLPLNLFVVIWLTVSQILDVREYNYHRLASEEGYALIEHSWISRSLILDSREIFISIPSLDRTAGHFHLWVATVIVCCWQRHSWLYSTPIFNVITHSMYVDLNFTLTERIERSGHDSLALLDRCCARCRLSRSWLAASGEAHSRVRLARCNDAPTPLTLSGLG